MSSQQLPTSQRAVHWAATPPQCTLSPTAAVPPMPSSGQNTLVKVLYSTINPIDYKLAALPYGLSRLALGAAPVTPATDFVGRVWSTTDPHLKGGDIVFGMTASPGKFGSLADFTVAPSKTMTKMPTGFDYSRIEELACIGVAGQTALQTLKAGNLPFAKSSGSQKGGNVFINGASGGVGTFTVQMAKHVFGCDKVVASCSGSNAELVKSLGADEVIDYRKGPVSEQLKAWSQKNGGAKFDHIVDNVGSDHTIYYQAHNYTTPTAKYTMVGGGLGLSELAGVAAMYLTPGFLGGGKRPFAFLGMSANKQDLDDIAFWMQEGKLKAIVEDENKLGFEDSTKAFQKLQSGRTRGKIVLKVSEDGQQ